MEEELPASSTRFFGWFARVLATWNVGAAFTYTGAKAPSSYAVTGSEKTTSPFGTCSRTAATSFCGSPSRAEAGRDQCE